MPGQPLQRGAQTPAGGSTSLQGSGALAYPLCSHPTSGGEHGAPPGVTLTPQDTATQPHPTCQADLS